MTGTLITTLSSPPPYSESLTVRDNAERLILEGSASQDAAAQTMSKALKSPETKRTIAEEIAQLAATVNEIRAANRKIRADLFNFDKVQFHDKFGAVIQLGWRWDKFSAVGVRTRVGVCLCFPELLFLTGVPLRRISTSISTKVTRMQFLRLPS